MRFLPSGWSSSIITEPLPHATVRGLRLIISPALPELSHRRVLNILNVLPPKRAVATGHGDSPRT